MMPSKGLFTQEGKTFKNPNNSLVTKKDQEFLDKTWKTVINRKLSKEFEKFEDYD